MKKIFLVFFILLFIFSAGGVWATWNYAELATQAVEKDIKPSVGEIHTAPPEGSLYITGITTSAQTAGSSSSNLYYVHPTAVHSTISLGAAADESVTLTVTVYNGSSEVYEYNAAKYTDANYSNGNVSFSATNLKTGAALSHGDPIAPGESLSFTVEFSYKDGYTPSGAEELESLINFEFLPLSELPAFYIKNVEVADGIGGYNSSSLGTNLLSATLDADALTIYKITMANRTDADYGYNGTAVDMTLVDNALVDYALYSDSLYTEKLLRQTLLPAAVDGEHGTLDIYLAAMGNESVTDESEINALFNIRFTTPIEDITPPGDVDDSGGVAVENAFEKFEEILNTDIELESLESILDNVPTSGGWFSTNLRDDSYVAYVPGAPEQDQEAALELFDGKLEILIDGEPQEVHFLIKREDVTGDGMDDYTIYLTTNTLTEKSTVSGRSGGIFSPYTIYTPAYATVYAAVFTVDEDENWIQLGDMFKGRAPICDYDGGMQSYRPTGGSTTQVPTGSGSFHTDTWVTTEAYYGVATGSTLSDVISAGASDTAGLAEAIAEAEALISDDDYEIIYTEESRAALATALANAEAAYSACTDTNTTNDPTQAEVETYTNELNKAIAQLEDAA